MAATASAYALSLLLLLLPSPPTAASPAAAFVLPTTAPPPSTGSSRCCGDRRWRRRRRRSPRPPVPDAAPAAAASLAAEAGGATSCLGTDPPPGGDYGAAASDGDSRYRALFDWATTCTSSSVPTRQPSAPPSAFVAPGTLRAGHRPSSGGGAGLFAARPIARGETLATLPPSARFDVPTVDGRGGGGALGDGPAAAKVRELHRRGEEMMGAGSGGGGGDELRMAAGAGMLAHLWLTRVGGRRRRRGRQGGGDDDAGGGGGGDTAVATAEAYGPFLDVQPLYPPLDPATTAAAGDGGRARAAAHPFPGHVLSWSDDEISNLLRCTAGRAKAESVRRCCLHFVEELMPYFVEEHGGGHHDRSGGESEEIDDSDTEDNHESTNSIKKKKEEPRGMFDRDTLRSCLESSFSSVLSRSFGGTAGRWGTMLPVLDLINHGGPGGGSNVRWNEVVDPDDECCCDEHDADEGNNDDDGGTPSDKVAFALVATRDVPPDAELLADYGSYRRQPWDFFAEYGFVPTPSSGGEESSCGDAAAAAAVPLIPPKSVNSDAVAAALQESSLLGPIVDVSAQAVANKFPGGEMAVVNVDDVVGAPGESGGAGAACVVISTNNNTRDRAPAYLVPFRAVACALSALSAGGEPTSSDVLLAAHGASDGRALNERALELLLEAVRARVKALEEGGMMAEDWIASQVAAEGMMTTEQSQRVELARTLREVEIGALLSLGDEAADLME